MFRMIKSLLIEASMAGSRMIQALMFRPSAIKSLLLIILLMGVSSAWAIETKSIERIKTFLGYYDFENPELQNSGCLAGMIELGGDAPEYTLNFSGTPLIALFSSGSEGDGANPRCPGRPDLKEETKVSFKNDTIDYSSTTIFDCSNKPKVARTTISLRFKRDTLSYSQSTSQTGSANHIVECKLVKKDKPSGGKLEPDPK